MTSIDVAEFVRDLEPNDLPDDVVHQAERCLIDLAAVAMAGSRTPMSRLMREHVVEYFGSDRHGVRLLADGRRASPAGAAMAGAATIDSLDGHDGHELAKGHVGATVLPALLAVSDAAADVTGAEFVTRVVLGYEIGTRAGIAQHATSPDYHASGSWNALAGAALGARAHELDLGQIGHALGIAEYAAPRGQMMRCVDHPTMVKDSSAWGAAAGISAVLLAARGFTGAPAWTVTTADAAELWRDLGTRWRILETYLKPYPVCRWAHPAVQAAITTVGDRGIRLEDVAEVEVITFDPAVRLTTRYPGTTEEAQYSLPFAVALAIAERRLQPRRLIELDHIDAAVFDLSGRVVLTEDPSLSARFPRERVATLRLTMADGQVITSAPTKARGSAADPLTDEEIHTKSLSYLTPLLGAHRSHELHRLTTGLRDAPHVRPLLDALLCAPAGVQ